MCRDRCSRVYLRASGIRFAYFFPYDQTIISKAMKQKCSDDHSSLLDASIWQPWLAAYQTVSTIWIKRRKRTSIHRRWLRQARFRLCRIYTFAGRRLPCFIAFRSDERCPVGNLYLHTDYGRKYTETGTISGVDPHHVLRQRHHNATLTLR